MLNKKKKKRTILILVAFILFACWLGTGFYLVNKRTQKGSAKKYYYTSDQISNFNSLERICTEVDYEMLSSYIENDAIDKVFAEFNDESYSSTLFFTLKDDEAATLYVANNPNYEGFKKELLDAGILVYSKADVFNYANTGKIRPSVINAADVASTAVNLGSLVLMVGFLVYFSGKMNSFNEEAGANAKDDGTFSKTFDDIGGLNQLKKDLRSVVDFIHDPDKYTRAGATLPSGILLVGPPGTGKTLIAKVMANEAQVDFLYANASDFVEKYVGTGAARVREIFRKARKMAPCIVFIDEIDALCGSRGSGMHSEDRKTLTALLTEMDGFSTNEGVMVIGATNRIEDMDEAALRPGRFSDIYTVPVPETVKERLEVIDIYMKNKKFAEDFDRVVFAKEMREYSPADIEAVLNEAAIISVVERKPAIDKKCIEDAVFKKVMHGHAKDNAETDKRDLKLIAYHEAGHTVMAKLHGKHVDKVTILPSTSGAGGVTFIEPSDRALYTKEMMEEEVMELYGGRVGEYLTSGEDWDKTTLGCSNDIQKATKILKDMVDAYGMSDNGLVNMNVICSETNDRSIEYILDIADKLKNRTVADMKAHVDMLNAIAMSLLENETLYEEDIDKLLYSDRKTA